MRDKIKNAKDGAVDVTKKTGSGLMRAVGALLLMLSGGEFWTANVGGHGMLRDYGATEVMGAALPGGGSASAMPSAMPVTVLLDDLLPPAKADDEIRRPFEVPAPPKKAKTRHKPKRKAPAAPAVDQALIDAGIPLEGY